MSNYAFSSSDVTDLVGITPIYLNALVHRELYGIAASISDRHGEIKFRVFSEDDVFGIALVWMLFESGLRRGPIKTILKQVGESSILKHEVETKEPDANIVAQFLFASETDYLVVGCEPRKPKSKRAPKVWAEGAMAEHLMGYVRKNPTANIVAIPIGRRFADIKKRIEALYRR
jgi:hypothetical protein